jgi:rod shape-determining protein MreD
MTAAPYRLLGPTERVRYWRSYGERALPGVVTLILVVLMTAPLFVAAPVMPNLALLGVLVWTSFQPGLMPAWLAFLLGAASDLLFGLPLGVNATLLPATVVFVRLIELRVAAHRYARDWLIASLIIVAAAVLEWQLLALGGVAGPVGPLLVQAATTILAYPAIVALFARIQRRLQALPR